jgi:hypothetical protein
MEPEQTEDALIRTLAEGVLAELEFKAGNIDAAAMAAARVVDEMPDPRRLVAVRAQAWLTRIRSLRASRRHEEARVQLERFAAWASSDPQTPAKLRMLVAQAEQALDDDSRSNAYRIYDEALRLARADAVPADIAGVAASYSNALIERGDTAKAVEVIGLLARWSATNLDCAIAQARLYRLLGRKAAWDAAVRQVRSLAGERMLPADLRSIDGEAVTANPG